MKYNDLARYAYSHLVEILERTRSSKNSVKKSFLIHKMAIKYGLGKRWVQGHLNNLEELGYIKISNNTLIMWIK